MPRTFELDNQEYTIHTSTNHMYKVYQLEQKREIYLGGFITESTDEETLTEQAEIVIEETR